MQTDFSSEPCYYAMKPFLSNGYLRIVYGYMQVGCEHAHSYLRQSQASIGNCITKHAALNLRRASMMVTETTTVNTRFQQSVS